MGRRRTRKAERRLERRTGEKGWQGLGQKPSTGQPGDRDAGWLFGRFATRFDHERRPDREQDWALLVGEPSVASAAHTCGRCAEFVEDGDLGRGTCLHPGSGVLHPWKDTPACDFWRGSGRLAGR